MSIKTPLHLLLGLLITIPFFDDGAAALAQPANACDAILKDAEAKYRELEIEQAIVLINTCLSQAPITANDRIAAYKLLSKAYVAKGDPESAKKNFKLILELDPNFTLIIGQERANVIQVLEEARREKRGEKLPPLFERPPVAKKGGSKKNLLLIGGGGIAVAAIVVTVLSSGGGGGGGGSPEDGFPKPPVRP